LYRSGGAHLPALGRLRKRITNSRAAWATWRKPILEEKRKRKERKGGKEKPQINNLSLQLKKPAKDYQMKPNVDRKRK
jgi:hypothetical protein